MRLGDFIDSSIENIIKEWESVVSKGLPSASAIDTIALRDYVPQILQMVASELRRTQLHSVPIKMGWATDTIAEKKPLTAAEVHGDLRAKDGFSMDQLFSEYRALRASVMRLWLNADALLEEVSQAEDVMRFNDALSSPPKF